MRQRQLYDLAHYVEVDRNGFYTLSTLNGLIRRQIGDVIDRNYKHARASVADCASYAMGNCDSLQRFNDCFRI